VIDAVPQLIDELLLRGLSEDMQPFLIEKLGLGADDAKTRCAAYLAEDPHVAGRRAELASKEKRLVAVWHQLASFGDAM
jgi:hypothetical protein